MTTDLKPTKKKHISPFPKKLNKKYFTIASNEPVKHILNVLSWFRDEKNEGKVPKFD